MTTDVVTVPPTVTAEEAIRLVRKQAAEMDRKRREATLHRIQQLMHDKVMVAPLWESTILVGLGPRVEESGLGLIAGYPWSAPYEDVKLRGK